MTQKTGPVRVLGIETSCDETSAAVIEDGRNILSNIIASQVELHARYGGVYPEVASRAHVEAVLPTIQRALSDAHLGLDDIDAIAVTYGPGLAGSLLVGVNTAKGLALGRRLPLVGVNHLEGHVYSLWLTGDSPPKFPVLCLIVSGGHTELVLMTDHLTYHRLGGTIDDAAGEAFDKVSRLLGLGYPGGPPIERAAAHGNPKAFPFSRARTDNPYDFSFSGLKTAVLRAVQDLESHMPKIPVADLAASFQTALVGALVDKTVRAAQEYRVNEILLAGGVSANKALRQQLSEASAPLPVRYPPLILCTDNAAMIAAAGYFRLAAGYQDSLDLDVIPNFPLPTAPMGEQLPAATKDRP